MLRKNAGLTILVISTLVIKLFSLFPNAVERYYSNGFYPYLASFQRTLLGWIPFSIGDLLYGTAAIYIIKKVVGFAWTFRKRTIDRWYLLLLGKRILITWLVIYCWFNISWGLNYNRLGIARQLELPEGEIGPQEIMKLSADLADSLNALAPAAYPAYNKVKKKAVLFSGALQSYDELVQRQPLFGYNHPSVKPSIYSYLGNYMGFTGYYNPFTGEAQVNTTVPAFVRPFTTCHEIGHQLGYAKEYEANLAAFLSASHSTDPVFRYSVYFEMYSYARPYLYAADSVRLKQLDSSLHPIVVKDIRELRRFILMHRNPVETMIDLFYSQYLRLNEQPSGRMSYNEVIVGLVGYYRKYKWSNASGSKEGN